jgi:hypothetical protein
MQREMIMGLGYAKMPGWRDKGDRRGSPVRPQVLVTALMPTAWPTNDSQRSRSDVRPLGDTTGMRGAYLHTGPEELYTQYGFTRVRKIAKWRWVMHAEV